MSFSLDELYRGTGTRFLLHAQSPVMEQFREPEVVWVSSPRGSVLPGPADLRMYTVYPVNKTPYEPGDMPPFSGAAHPRARPDRHGHFDHLQPETPEFVSAHLFGSVRRVLDIWEIYAGGPVPWHFQAHHERLEMIAHVPWKNAQFGWGYCECGEDVDDRGNKQPFSLNFDIIAHEVGHGLVYSMTGIPAEDGLTSEFLGFHESASDLVAIISGLHFDSFVNHVLKQTSGNLHMENELNRIGELSKTRQIRKASNIKKMSDMPYRHKAPSELTGHEIHELGVPLTGAFFDIAIGFFLRKLVAAGQITEDYARQIARVETEADVEATDHGPMLRAYQTNPSAFVDALKDARDMLGLRLAQTWHGLRPTDLTFEEVVRVFLNVDRRLTGAEHQPLIHECFTWRNIRTGQ